MLERRFALLLAAALSVAGVDGACSDYGEDECPCLWNYQYGYCEETCSGLSEEECSDACEWVDSSQNCQTACSEYTEDWACDGSYCSWSYEDGVCETSCSSLGEDACDAEPMCEFIDSWHSCQTACSLFQEEWECRDDYCSWSYEDGVCEAGCEAKYGDEDECGEHPCRNQIFNPTSMWA